MYFWNFWGGSVKLILGAIITTKQPLSLCIVCLLNFSWMFWIFQNTNVSNFSKHGCFEVVRIFSTPAGADHTAELNIALLGNGEA